MTEETKFPTIAPKRRRSSLKRQRMAVLIILAVVVVLAVAFALIFYFTSRIPVEYPNGERVVDTDGTKYYVVKKDGIYIMRDSNGEDCAVAEDGLYKTKDGVLVSVDTETGKPTVVAAVLLNGTEVGHFDATDGAYDILLYPRLERADISSIRVHNVERDEETGEIIKVNDFAFVRQSGNVFELEGHEGTPYDSVLFSTLVVITGYTDTLMRLDIANAYEINDDGSYKYEDYEGFRTNGYAEYGLPEDCDDAENYFVITALDGTEHKVVIGDIIMDDTGYYARYNGREEVYILSQMEESDYNGTLSQALLGAMEDYVTPTVVMTMGSTNYFDVSDFSIYTVGDFTNKDSYKQLVSFSYEPIELRRGTYYANTPYVGEDVLDGYAVDNYQADICLQNLMDMIPLRTVELFNAVKGESDLEANRARFVEKYCLPLGGNGFYIEFTLNAARGGEEVNYAPVKDEQYDHAIWISPMTKDGTYYMYSERFNMVVETGRAFLEYLEWSTFDWVAAEVFTGNISYLTQMDVTVKDGVTINGVDGKINNLSFKLSYVDANGNPVAGNDEKALLQVLATYGANSRMLTSDEDTMRFRRFYQVLLYSTLEGSMPAGTEAKQQELRDSGAAGADLVITMTFDPGNGAKPEVRTYCFYFGSAGTRGCYMTMNGKGSFYMLQSRLNKIVADLPNILNGETIKVP